MQSNGVLDNFILPDGAVEEMASRGAFMQQMQPGVSIMSGQSGGLAYRFFSIQEKDEKASKLAKIPVFKARHMIEWNKGKRYKPTEQVRFLPEALLMFDEDGNAHGEYAESWNRYIKGLTAKGTPLHRWGELDDSIIATLTATGIFSVEQFAALPRGVVSGKYPHDILEKFDLAIEFVNGQSGRFEYEALAKQAADFQTQIAKRDTQMDELRAEIEKLKGAKKPVKKKAKEPTDETA